MVKKIAKANGAAASKVPGLFREYFETANEIEAAKAALEELVSKRSDIVKAIVKESGKYKFTVNGNILEHRSRTSYDGPRTNEDGSPNLNRKATGENHFFVTRGGEDSLQVDVD